MTIRGLAAIAAFAACIPAANWLIGNVGTVCIPDGPCLIPVAPGLMAPSGVLMIGVALVLRDAVQEACGVGGALAAIVLGGVVSLLVAPAALAIASVSAFVASELGDLVVYTPLRRRRLALAVLASGVVGAAVDSALFLWLAFGALDYFPGQLVGKAWASALAVVVLLSLRRRHREVA